MDIYNNLKDALQEEASRHNVLGQRLHVRCKALSVREAIGNPEHHDYPIIRGKEVMVEADFKGAKGQAFTDEFEQADYRVEDLLTLALGSNKKRASFIAGLNAVFRHLELCEKTIHCKDREPIECAGNLLPSISPEKKVLLIGFQPRFFEMLAETRDLRAIDLNPENIGKEISNVVVEAPEMTDDAMTWCDLIFATGSTLVNGTISRFLTQEKPVLFYGVTISASAKILDLNHYCYRGH